MNDLPVIWSPLVDLLQQISHRIVVVGSVARGVRWPEDIDFLWDLDSEPAKKEIRNAIQKSGLRFDSPCIGCWTFTEYGWMVEILATHHGPSYKAVRRRAHKEKMFGVEFWVAQPEDAPKN